MTASAQAPLGITNMPVSVVQELLTKYKFISTCGVADANHRSGHSFVWHEKDPYFRQLPVACTGFAENGGTVYVCGGILSLLSEDLKLKIERNQRITFHCNAETFNTVMTFLHSTNGTRPTFDFLLALMPVLTECSLPFLCDLCAYVVSMHLHRYSSLRLLMTAFRAESELLLRAALMSASSNHTLRGVIECSNAFREVRRTVFGAEALGKLMELMLILPEEPSSPGPSVDSRRAAFFEDSFPGLAARFQGQFRAHLPDVTVSSHFLDFPLTVGREKLYVSRPVLAQTSGFFHKLFYGDFTEQRLTSFAVANATAEELKSLLVLLFPTPWGIWWRLVPSTGDAAAADVIYKSPSTFGGNLLRFAAVFRLAEYYQIAGLVGFLTDVAVHCLPWRQRLQLADSFKSREIMASLLTEASLKELKKEMAASATVLDEFSSPTKNLIVEVSLRASIV